MVGYSYFNYNQMTLLEVEVHSDQLELLKNAADEYDWNRIEPAFYVACEFTSHPAARTLRDFDQIMCEYGLWDIVHDVTYRKNVVDRVIDEKAEDTLNIDNTHLLGYSTPGKYVKECRECDLFSDCEDKVSTDETADWYIKGKYTCYYAHQVGMS